MARFVFAIAVFAFAVLAYWPAVKVMVVFSLLYWLNRLARSVRLPKRNSRIRSPAWRSDRLRPVVRIPKQHVT